MAFQSVYEEKVLVKYDIPPLLAVGWEGVFGFSVLSILLIPMGYWKVKIRVFFVICLKCPPMPLHFFRFPLIGLMVQMVIWRMQSTDLSSWVIMSVSVCGFVAPSSQLPSLTSLG